MSTWTLGYVADVGYTFGYYTELNPLRLKLAFANSGLVFPEAGTACELGFGQGLSTNIHAAASTCEWYGTDFNPAQAGFAQDLAAGSGSRAKLYDESFADFCSRGDLPEFDFIGLHGIWSWISDENRGVIVDFIRRKLKVGGVLYISYNTLPGWAAFAPMRHLMTEHAEVLGSQGRGIVSRIDGAIEFADKLLELNPLYSQANPQIADRIKRLKGMNRHYLAHEYFNRDWHPMHFATMAQWLEPAKVQYACSANLLDHVDSVNLTKEQQQFLAEIPDPMFRQSVRDFVVNQQFRKDYWVKGARNMTPLGQLETIRAMRLMLTTPRADVPMKVTGARGEAALTESVYNPILDAMGDHKVHTIGGIEAAVAPGVVTTQLIQALFVLASSGHVQLVQDEDTFSQAKRSAEKLNLKILRRARESNDLAYLASPATGGGVNLNRFQQLFVLALKEGKKSPAQWAESAWAILKAQNQRLIREGKPIETDEDNVAELTRSAGEFATKMVPILKSMGMI